jgi:hypothetical protein
VIISRMKDTLQPAAGFFILMTHITFIQIDPVV